MKASHIGKHDEVQDGHFRRPTGNFEVMVGREGSERGEVFPGHVPFDWIDWPFAGRSEVPHPERGDCVEGEALLQVVSRFEPAVLDTGADLQRVEEVLGQAWCVTAHRPRNLCRTVLPSPPGPDAYQSAWP